MEKGKHHIRVLQDPNALTHLRNPDGLWDFECVRCDQKFTSKRGEDIDRNGCRGRSKPSVKEGSIWNIFKK